MRRLGFKACCTILHLFLLAIVSICASELKIQEVLCIVIPIILLYCDYYAQKRFFTLFNIFIIVLCIFHYGEFWLDLFGIPIDTSSGHDIFLIYDDRSIVKALSFSLSSLVVLNCSAILFLNKTTEYNISSTDTTDYGISKIIFFLLLPLMIYNDLSRIVLTQTFSYSEAVYMTTFLSRFEICFVISGLFLILRKNVFSKYIFGFFVCRAIILMIFTGSRIGMILELILFLFVFTINTKLSLKKVFILGLFSYVCLILIGYVKSTRGTFGIPFGEYISQGGFISSQLSEFGSTMETLILAISYDKIVGGLSGMTYLAAILTIIPFSTKIFPFIVKYRVAHDFLNPFAPSVGALGGSFFAEQYLNFGHAGIVLSILFGVLFAKLQNSIYKQNKPFNAIICIALFYGVIIYSRANMYDFIATVCGVIYYVVFYWIIKLLKR